MNKVNTDRKLELIRNIRMQNHYDRQQFRTREQFLYGTNSMTNPVKPEIYSLEASALEPAMPILSHHTAGEKKSSVLSGFRIRLLIAILLFGFYIFMDKTGFTVQGQNAGSVYEMIQTNLKLPDSLGNIFDF